ncbi:BPI fold-containing family B member 4-like, partial [Egretta garzetta]|uniref:BPI fold-containing family B member 4-like n=1 Tax=Egretta garzetta TaxID=188379 RepID=UPI00163D3D15
GSATRSFAVPASVGTGPRMSALWGFLLLCSLLTPSQGRGIVASAAKADADDAKHLLAKRDLQKLRGGLLEKDIPLGGRLGKNGAVGGLLGRDGAVGGLPGGDGLLGGLLGRNGLLDGLLGGDGVLGGLLGRDGVLHCLLGRHGLLGGLLGSLLGKDGAVGSLLGKDGVVDGLAGGLLGGDGLVGGLLGRDGLLHALLGKDGLVDDLLDAVLDILLGKDGVLGKDGLVGNLLGGNGGDLPGLKIVNNTVPKIRLRSLPGFGHEVGLNTQLLVESTSARGRVLCLQVEADVVMLVQGKGAARQNSEDCKTLGIDIRVRPNVPLLDQPLKRFLSDALRELGCDIANNRLKAVRALLGLGTPALPLGALGDLPPFSIIGGNAIQLDLNVSASTSQPKPLGLAELGPFLQALPTSVPRSSSLGTPALRVANPPVVALRGRRATATLQASIDILSPVLQSSQEPLLSLEA